MRGVRYGEVLAVFARDTGLHAEVFGTQMLNDCPQALWDTLDAVTLAAEMGAVMVKLNGPRYWTIDGLGQKVAVVESRTMHRPSLVTSVIDSFTDEMPSLWTHL